MELGAILYAEEKIHGQLHKLKFRLKKIEPNRKIEFQNLFPISLISPKGSFIIEPKGNASLFTATLSFRFGSLLSALAKKRIEVFKKPMKEEGENLKRLLEEQL